MANFIPEIKQKLRTDMRRQLKELQADPARQKQYAAAAMEQVLLHSDWEHAQTILCFTSLPDEVDTSMLIGVWRRAGKQVLLPRVVGDELELRYYDPDQVDRGAYGILEPTAEAQLFEGDLRSIDLAFIPGLAFTQHGERLGRGRGYYDRLLPQLGPRTYGLCYPFQLVEELPTEPWDARVSRVFC